MQGIVIKESTLNCGLRLVTFQHPLWRNFALRHVYHVGAFYESEGKDGLTHFMEHLITSDEFSRNPLLWGNACTSFDHVSIEASRFLEEDLPIALEEIARYRRGLDIREFVREKKVIIDEMGNYLGSASAKARAKFSNLSFPGIRLGISGGGRPESLSQITEQDLMEHWQRYYGDKNACLYIASGMEHTALEEIINLKLNLPQHCREEYQKTPNYILPKPVYLVESLTTPSDHIDVYINFRSLSAFGNGNSLLAVFFDYFRRRFLFSVRFKESVAYHNRFYRDETLHHGEYIFNAELSPDRLRDYIKCVSEEVKNAAYSVKTEDIQETIKTLKRKYIEEDITTPDEFMDRKLELYILTGKIKPIDDLMRELISYSPEQLMDLVRWQFGARPRVLISGREDLLKEVPSEQEFHELFRSRSGVPEVSNPLTPPPHCPLGAWQFRDPHLLIPYRGR